MRRSGLFERFDALPDPGDARDDATQRLLRFGLRRLIGSGGQQRLQDFGKTLERGLGGESGLPGAGRAVQRGAGARHGGRAGGGVVAAVRADLDSALLGLLVADQGRVVTPGVLDALLLLNPADAYRLLNLAGDAAVAALAGMAGPGEAGRLPERLLLASLAGWIAVPLALAVIAFRRRQP